MDNAEPRLSGLIETIATATALPVHVVTRVLRANSGAPGGTAPVAPMTAGTIGGIPAAMARKAVVADFLSPGAGKEILAKSVAAPSTLAVLEGERAQIAAANPRDPRLPVYDAQIAHLAGAPTGYLLDPNGGFTLAPGYAPGQGAITNATEAAKYPYTIGAQNNQAANERLTNALHPATLRGPGSVYVNPYFGQTVQIPNEINEVDPKTLAEYKRFVPLGLSVTGSGPLSSAAAAPSQGAPSPAGRIPLAFKAAAPQISPITGLPVGTTVGQALANQQNAGAGAPTNGEAGGTSFMTAPPPGQKEIVENLAKNYGEEGKKAYASAVAGLGSTEYIARAINQLGPTGWYAMGEGADLRNDFAKTVNSWEQSVGMKPTFDANKIASWEDFRKETTLLGMKGLAQIFGGSREAASIIQTSIHAVPNPENSYVGGTLLVNAYKEAFQREVDLRNFETNWIAQHGGNLTGATEAFNQQYPPQAYSQRAISKVQPYSVKSPADLKRFLPGTVVKTPDGKERVIPGPTTVPLQGAPNG